MIGQTVSYYRIVENLDRFSHISCAARLEVHAY
jgi:hypothetical protein